MERRQEKFCLEMLRTGNATEAYKSAGYKPGSDTVAASSAWRLLRNEKVAARIAELRKVFVHDSVMCALERREMLSYIARNNDVKVCDRIKAIDTLNKMDALYTTRLAGADGGPFAFKFAWRGKDDDEARPDADDDEDATDEDDDE